MDDQQKYIDGFLQGWQSIAGPRLHFPDIPVLSSRPAGSPFIHGLIAGIAAAKKEIVAVSVTKEVSAKSFVLSGR
jgi:hypothetical protein